MILSSYLSYSGWHGTHSSVLPLLNLSPSFHSFWATCSVLCLWIWACLWLCWASLFRFTFLSFFHRSTCFPQTSPCMSSVVKLAHQYTVGSFLLYRPFSSDWLTKLNYSLAFFIFILSPPFLDFPFLSNIADFFPLTFLASPATHRNRMIEYVDCFQRGTKGPIRSRELTPIHGIFILICGKQEDLLSIEQIRCLLQSHSSHQSQ